MNDCYWQSNCGAESGYAYFLHETENKLIYTLVVKPERNRQMEVPGHNVVTIL
jgi:hypothetical protein